MSAAAEAHRAGREERTSEIERLRADKVALNELFEKAGVEIKGLRDQRANLRSDVKRLRADLKTIQAVNEHLADENERLHTIIKDTLAFHTKAKAPVCGVTAAYLRRRYADLRPEEQWW